jgi:hypothetical protein
MVGIGMGAAAAYKERSVGANATVIAGLCVVSTLPDLEIIAFALAFWTGRYLLRYSSLRRR